MRNLFVDDFLVAKINRGKRESKYGADESKTPEWNESDEFIRDETDDTGNGCVGNRLGKYKALKLEDEKVEYIGDFIEKHVKCILVELVVLTGFHAPRTLRSICLGRVRDDSLACDEFGDRFDGGSEGKADP